MGDYVLSARDVIRKRTRRGELVLEVGARGAVADVARAEGRRALGFARKPDRPDILPAGGAALPLPARCVHLAWVETEKGDEPGDVLREVRRVLRPGGTLVLVARTSK